MDCECSIHEEMKNSCRILERKLEEKISLERTAYKWEVNNKIDLQGRCVWKLFQFIWLRMVFSGRPVIVSIVIIGTQILRARWSRRLKFVRWRKVFVGPHNGSYYISPQMAPGIFSWLTDFCKIGASFWITVFWFHEMRQMPYPGDRNCIWYMTVNYTWGRKPKRWCCSRHSYSKLQKTASFI
jgi:hypothetical protein